MTYYYEVHWKCTIQQCDFPGILCFFVYLIKIIMIIMLLLKNIILGDLIFVLILFNFSIHDDILKIFKLTALPI